MTTNERLVDRIRRQAARAVRMIADEFRTARLSHGLSQREVAEAAQISRAAYGRLERGEVMNLSLPVVMRVAAVLGLDVSVRLYPGPEPLRDAAQAKRLQKLLGHVGPPLRYRTDVPLPRNPDGHRELRAWDAVLYGHVERTAIELESRITDAQAITRRHGLKRRDDPPDHFLLVMADTRHNRAVVREYADLFADLPRLRTANVLKVLRAGQHPPTGYILL